MATPNDRGFNNIQSSRVAKREKTYTLQKYTLLGVIALAALTVFMVVLMAVGGIIANVDGSRPGPDGEKVDWGSFTVTATDTLQGPLVLVNNDHAYTFPATGEHLSEIYNTFVSHSPRKYVQSGLSTYMDTKALEALDAMLVDFYNTTGKDNVQIRYAYRDLETQEQFEIAAGHSDHHTGLGVQLKFEQNGNAYAFSTDPDGTYNWLFDNCHRYGFVIRYPEGKEEITGISDYSDYFRYVGVAHATYMKDQDLCMEEYVEKLKDYDNEKPLEIKGADGKYYEVYYVAVDGSATVKHPTNYAYTVSGTNEGGVVVTVDRSQTLKPETSDTSADAAADTAADTSAGANAR